MSSCTKQVLVLCTMGLIAGLVAAWLHPRRPPWTRDRFRSQALWVDVTPPTMGASAKPPETLHPTPGDWDGFLASLLERWSPGQPVMVCCERKSCAEAEVVTRRLRESGLDRVYILRDHKP